MRAFAKDHNAREIWGDDAPSTNYEMNLMIQGAKVTAQHYPETECMIPCKYGYQYESFLPHYGATVFTFIYN